MKTLKDFIAETHIDEDLVRAVVRQCGGWRYFKDGAEDVAAYGAAGGTFGGFIYYTDTVKFARKCKKAILQMAAELASDCGDGDEFQLIAGFNCLRSDDLSAGAVARAIYTTSDENHTSVMNALAWFALEEVARSYTDLVNDY